MVYAAPMGPAGPVGYDRAVDAIGRWRLRLRESPLGYRMASGAFWLTAGAVASRASALAAGALAARLLGRSRFGELAILQGSLNLFSVFAGFGLGLTAAKHVSELRAKDPERAGRVIALSSAVSLVTGAAAAAALAAAAPWLASSVLEAPRLAGLLRLSAPTLVFGAWAGAQTGALSGFEAFRRLSRVQCLAGLAAFPLTLGGVWLAGLPGAVWGLVLSSAVACLLNRGALRAEMRAAGVPAARGGLGREWGVLWRFSIPAALGSAMIGPVNWLCNALLVRRPDGYPEMGLLHAAYQWRLAMIFVPAAAEAMLLPVLSSLRASADSAGYRRALKLNLAFSAALSVLAAAAVAVAAGPILRSYGAGFDRGVPALRWSAASVVFAAPLTVLAQAIASAGSMWWGLSLNLAWGAVMLAASVRLVGRGAAGVAEAMCLAYAVQLGASVLYAWIVLRQPPFVERYARFRRVTPRSMLRHAALSALAAAGRRRDERERALGLPRVHLVYLHSVFEDEEDAFRALVRELARTHRLAGYGEAVARLREGPIGRPWLAFSFDDGYKNCLRAARVLEEFGATGCFFVCPAIVGERRAERVREFCRDRLRTPPVEFLSWEDLERLKRAGHEIGSHTRTHARLALLDRTALEEELAGSKAELESRLGPVRHFAWPFGRFLDAHAGLAAAAVRAGYESCASAERGCHVSRADAAGPLCLRREHLVAGWPIAHARYFLARSARRASPGTNRWPPELLS